MPQIAGSLAWDEFRLIEAIAEAGTLPQAAAALGLDHSTVFRRLRQIEAALGTKAFERHRSGYVPTAAGAELVALAARMNEDVTAVLRRIAGLSPSPAGEVRVATSDALLLHLLMPILAAFRASCPAVQLDIVTGNTALNLSRRDADVAIRATAAPPDTLVGRKTARIAWAAYGRAVPADDGVTEDGLAALDTDWVGFGDALSGLAADRLIRAQVTGARITCRFDTIGGLAAGIEAGLGAGLLPCFIGDQRPALVRITAPLASLSTDLWLLTHPDLRQVPRIRVLMDFLAERLIGQRNLIDGQSPHMAPRFAG